MEEYMMQRMKTAGALALALVVLCFALPSLADTPVATGIYVGGVLLDEQTPYLASGGTTATAVKPQSGGYAYFDAAAGTLLLNGITLYTIADAQGVPQSLLYADGSLTVELSGETILRYTTDTDTALLGVAAKGTLTIGGDGSLKLIMNNFSDAADNTLMAISAGGSLLVEAGAIEITITSGQTGFGLYAVNGIELAGGDVQCTVEAKAAHAVYVENGDAAITGGSLLAVAHAAGEEDTVTGLHAANISIAGGQATFKATGGQEHSIGAYLAGSITASGGRMRLIGDTRALHEESAMPLQGDTVIPVYTAEATSGAGMQLWTNQTQEALPEESGDARPVRFVQLGDYPAEETAPVTDTPKPKETKERSTGFWMGIGLIALIVGIMLGGYTRKRR